MGQGSGSAATGADAAVQDSAITGVTVFRDGARVSRAGEADVPQGLRRVRAGTLPAAADPASVRVAVRGHGVALLEVLIEHHFRADPLREKPARLRDDVEKLRDAVREIEDEDAAEVAGLGFLTHLTESAATSLARAVSAGRAGYEDLARMAAHLTSGTASALGRRREIAARLRGARRELDAAEQRLADAERRKSRVEDYYEVVVVLDAQAAATAVVDLTYHVSGASWRPLYDLVLNGETLSVTYLAEVTQQTGEDWPQTRLVLSTARQGQHHGLPELSPWYIGRPVPPAVRHAARMGWRAQMAPAGAPAEEPAFAGAAPMAAAAPEPPLPPQALTAEVGQGGEEAGAGISYAVARPLEVPADGGPHKTTVATFDAGAVLDYLTVPVLAAEAYLRATATNGPLLLLPGQARVFHGPEFVGETALETVAAGEEFEVQLGVDDRIRVERKLTRRATSKALVGGTRTIDVGYEITVENHRGGKAKVSVRDHVPLSRDGDIKVRVREANPAPASQDDLGELTWSLTLDDGKSATIRHRFTVEHPANVTVTGL